MALANTTTQSTNLRLLNKTFIMYMNPISHESVQDEEKRRRRGRDHKGWPTGLTKSKPKKGKTTSME